MLGGVALVLALVALSLAAVATTLHRGDGTVAADRPNVIVIVSDDLDTSVMPYLPNVQKLIGDQGATLDRFYVEQGTCCTSRATILSGEYAHNHRVEANAWPLGGFERWHDFREKNALPVWLDKAGYRTALMGKYFNEYPAPASFPEDVKKASMTFVPPGWDDWMVPVQGNAYAQDHYRLNVNGTVDPEFRTTFLDDVLGDHLDSLAGGASGFDLAAGGNFLYYASYSPHTPYAYPEKYADQFSDLTYPRKPSFDEADVSDKFGMTRTKHLLGAAKEAEIDAAYRDRVRSVQELDHNVANLVTELRDQGTLDNTYIMFLSDNGYNMGEHRREIGKYNQFEETVRVPMMVRGPGITPGTRIEDVVGNVDLAPTIAAITGATPAYAVDGVDLLPLLSGKVDSLDRDGLLLGRALLPAYRTAPAPIDEVPENFVADDRISRLNDFTGVVTRRWKLIRYTHMPHEELYDLRNDPYELTNLLPADAASYAAMDPAMQQVVTRLRSSLDRLVACQGVDCR